MATMALTILDNSWALLNVITCSDDSRLGLLGGVLCCARATEGLAWIISVLAIVSAKMFKELDARNAVMIMKTSDGLHTYIFACVNI